MTMKNKIMFCFALLALALSPAYGAKSPRPPKVALIKKNNPRKVPTKQLQATNANSITKQKNQATQSSNSGVLQASYEWYLDQCTTNPIVTKSLSAAIVSSIGDFLSQQLEAHVAESNLPFSLNPKRMGTFFLCGLLFVGPFMHAWYDQLIKMATWMEQRYGTLHVGQVLAQLLVDQTLGVILFFPTYFYVHEYMESLIQWRVPSLSRAHTKCMEQIVKVVLMQYRIFPVCNLINFAMVPKQLRVLFSNGVAVFWNIYLCTIMA